MSDRDADIAMAGIILAALLFFGLVTSCLCHVPRGPDRCVVAP